MIVPNAALPKEPFGSFSGGVLLTLKTSARNSKLSRSVMRNVLPIIRSAFCKPGPAHRIARTVADGELPAARECRVIEPLRRAASREVVRIADAVRPLHRIAEGRESCSSPA